MTNSWRLFKVFNDGAIYIKEGKAIFFTYGYAVGGEIGYHNFLNSFALAEIGTVDYDGEFQADVYTSDDAPNRMMIGRTKEYEGYNTPDNNSDEINWEDYDKWVNKVLEMY